MVKNCLRCGRPRFDPWVRKILWRRKWQPALAWRIPWTEEPGGLLFMGLQRIGQDWVTNTFCMPNSGLRANQGKVSTPGRWVLPGSGLGVEVYRRWARRAKQERGREERLGPVPGLTPGARSWTFCQVRCGACPWRTACRDRSHGEQGHQSWATQRPHVGLEAPSPAGCGNHWEGERKERRKIQYLLNYEF